MPLDKKAMKEIEESHRCRPYLIMDKDDKNIYAYPSSSSHSRGYNYYIDREKYNNLKDSWLNLQNIFKVPVFNLKEKFYTLNKEDRLEIQKKLQSKKGKSKKYVYNLTKNYNISKGDIVSINNNLNYVYKCTKESIYCYKVYTNSKCGKRITQIIVRNKKYYIDLESGTEYDIKNNIIIYIYPIIYIPTWCLIFLII